MSTEAVTAVPEERTTTGTAARWVPSPQLALIAVAVVYTLVVFARIPHSMTFTWDEVVYASQVARDVPPAGFNAHRARGVPLLLSPVAVFTSEVVVLRTYLTLLAGLWLYLAFLPWLWLLRHRSVVSAYVPAFAAALLGTLWLTILYGSMAYPNLWLALTLIGATGLFCLAGARRDNRLLMLVGLAAAFALASLLRPADALAAATPVALAGLAHRWFWQVGAALAGTGLGWGQWATEAYQRFGGPLARLREAAENTGSGLTWTLGLHIDALDGPYLLCQPSRLCEGVALSASLWALVLPVLVAVGLVAAQRYGHLTAMLAASGAAVFLALPYLLLFENAHPRFLLPTYALLLLPAAYGILWAVVAVTPRAARVAAAVLVVAALAGHVAVQQEVLDRVLVHRLKESDDHAVHAAYLREVHGVQPPCLMIGLGAIQQSYLLRCHSVAARADTLAPYEGLVRSRLDDGSMVVIRLKAVDEVPAFMDGWRRVQLPHNEAYVAYLPPRSG